MRNRPLDPNTTLRIQRTLAAPRELVFRAWTQPEMLRRWWGIEAGYTTPIAEIDLRVGGKYRLGMQPPNQDMILVVGGTSGRSLRLRDWSTPGPGRSRSWLRACPPRRRWSP